MRTHLLLGMLVALNTLGLFLTQLLVFTEFGTGSTTDAFVAATTIPQTLTVIVSVSLYNVLVPLFAGEGIESQHDDAWGVLSLLALVALVFSASLYASCSWWIPLVFPGFDTETAALCIDLTRIQVFSILFTVAAGVTTAVYHARHQFVLVATRMLIITSLSVLALYFLLPIYGIEMAAWVVLLSAVFQFFVLTPSLGLPRKKILFSPAVKASWNNMKPMLAGNAYYKTDILVDRYLLSMGAAGDLSLYSLGRQVYDAAGGIISKVLGNTAIPRLAIFFKGRDRVGFKALSNRRLLILSGLAVLGYIILLFSGESLLGLLVGYGQMKGESIHQLWQLMVLLGGTFVFGIVGSLLAGMFYAIGDTRTPTYMSVISFTFFILIKILSYRYFGIYGLCIATSVYFFTNALLMLLLFPGKFRQSLSHV